jgi:ApbE superfamily uncharacterized protein (UPF0280 family)
LGIADAVTVFSGDVALADAWATSVCNQISPDNRTVLEHLDRGEVEGIFAIIGEEVIRWGKIPPLFSADVDEQLISAGDRI